MSAFVNQITGISTDFPEAFRADMKKKSCITDPLHRESTDYPWIPMTKGLWSGKSSCHDVIQGKWNYDRISSCGVLMTRHFLFTEGPLFHSHNLIAVCSRHRSKPVDEAACLWVIKTRIGDHSGYRYSQWETTLQCNVVSNLLSPYPE